MVMPRTVGAQAPVHSAQARMLAPHRRGVARVRHNIDTRAALAVLETEGLRASQPVSKKQGQNPALSFQRLVSTALSIKAR